MALLSFFTSCSSRTPFTFYQNPKPLSLSSLHFHLSLSPTRFPSLRFSSSSSSSSSAAASGDKGDADKASASPAKITDEWGEDYDPEAETPSTKLPDSDPPENDDEWEERGGDIDGGNGTAAAASTKPPAEEKLDGELEGLKRALVDTVYGTELGFRAGSEVRAEVSELVTQLEAANPTPNSVEEPELLNGNWVLLYTASSELLPLIAAGTLPLLKVDKISQTIDTNSFTIINSVTFSSPFASLSLSASASFEVRSPSRIQVTFKEGTLEPPEIKSRVELPENVDIFGQKLSLLSLQQSLSPLQNAVANISRVISGQPPVKIPIPGERTSSWLITTYLDQDLRISRGDGGGLFILAREGSPLLDQ